MKTTIISIIIAVVSFIGGYQYFNHTKLFTDNLVNEIRIEKPANVIMMCEDGKFPTKLVAEAPEEKIGGLSSIGFSVVCEDDIEATSIYISQ